MEIFIIAIVTFTAAILTFFTGFRLATILAPVFIFFFPIEIAIALTGIVHFSKNLPKAFQIGKYFNANVLIRFGIPAIIASFVGAWLLLKLISQPEILSYTIHNHIFSITPANTVIGLLLLSFILYEMYPSLKFMKRGRTSIVTGGLLSGFFGGFSGLQGTIRNTYLMGTELSKEAYLATGVIIACFVDITRLYVYFYEFDSAKINNNILLIIIATTSALIGSAIGKKLIHKAKYSPVQAVVTILIIVVSVALSLGFLSN